MNDAEARLAERLAEDLERILGTGILIQDVEIEGEGPVTITVACLVDGSAEELRAEGTTVLEAISAVIRQAAERRLTAAYWQIVGPT